MQYICVRFTGAPACSVVDTESSQCVKTECICSSQTLILYMYIYPLGFGGTLVLPTKFSADEPIWVVLAWVIHPNCRLGRCSRKLEKKSSISMSLLPAIGSPQPESGSIAQFPGGNTETITTDLHSCMLVAPC